MIHQQGREEQAIKLRNRDLKGLGQVITADVYSYHKLTGKPATRSGSLKPGQFKVVTFGQTAAWYGFLAMTFQNDRNLKITHGLRKKVTYLIYFGGRYVDLSKRLQYKNNLVTFVTVTFDTMNKTMTECYLIHSPVSLDFLFV